MSYLFPHAALDSPGSYRFQGSQESLYDEAHSFFTPPITRPQNHVFFNSDDSLYKTELRKLNIPVFKLEVTDFSEPSPRNITFECENYDDDDIVNESDVYEGEMKGWKNKPNSFFMQKSQSFDVPSIQIEMVNDTDNYLNISGGNKLSKNVMYSSLQDLSSSTSSVNSIVHESNLDLSTMDPDTPIKHRNWKSPDEIRKGHVKTLTKHFEGSLVSKGSKSSSTPDVNRSEDIGVKEQKVYFSEEKIDSKLSDIERLEVLKLLLDWSTQGSEAKDTGFSLKLSENLKKTSSRSKSEPNLSPSATRSLSYNIFTTKYSSESDVLSTNLENDFLHKCRFRNCIFNTNFQPNKTGTNKETRPKSILKPTQLNNITNLQHEKNFLGKCGRRHSEIIETNEKLNEGINRCDSLEQLTNIQKKRTLRTIKKFPESYIIRKASKTNNEIKNSENVYKSPKIVIFRRKCIPKTWRSCSDIKYKQMTVRKCCKNAKKSCPVFKISESENGGQRRTQSCLDIDRENLDGRVGSGTCCSKT